MKLYFLILLHTFPLCIYPLNWATEGRAGYFRFANSSTREIYDNGTADVELESLLFVNRYFTPWLNISYVWKSGKTEALSDPTNLKMGMISFGSKIIFPHFSSPVSGYLGAGCCGGYLHLHDQTTYLPNKTIRWGAGLVGKSGILMNVKQKVFFDLFLDYYFLPVKTRNTVSSYYLDIGGLRIGAGMGFIF